MTYREDDFEVLAESWNSYRLADGTTVQVKTVVRKVFREVDAGGTPLVNLDGEPKVRVNHALVVVARPRVARPVVFPDGPAADEPVH